MPHRLGVTPVLTDRERDVAQLLERYVAGAQELPSTSWLSRRLGISRQSAWRHLDALRTKGWLDRLRRN